MEERTKRGGIGAVGGAIGVLLFALIVVLVVAYTGSYNVAASKDHTPFVRWMFDTIMQNSVKARADGIEPPGRFSGEMVAAGAREYKSMCQHCHGAPGSRKDVWPKGMLPQPPHLPDVVTEWDPSEVFWLVKHGVKMTGMPAFGENHDDAEIWNIVSFVVRLPGMTADEYGSLAPEAGADGRGHSH